MVKRVQKPTWEISEPNEHGYVKLTYTASCGHKETDSGLACTYTSKRAAEEATKLIDLCWACGATEFLDKCRDAGWWVPEGQDT